MSSNGQPTVVDILWNRLLGQLVIDRSKDVLEISGSEYALLNDETFEVLQLRYASSFKKAPMLVRDSARLRYFLGSPNRFEHRKLLQIPKGEVVMIDSKSPIDPALNLKNARVVKDFPVLDSDGRIVVGKKQKVPRPPNAFILYRRDHHPVVKAANPGIHNNDISVIIGAQWSAESLEVRTAYKSLADKTKREHSLKHPGYHYQPRKSSEKKRRMTKKKAAALTDATPDYQLMALFAPAPLKGHTLTDTGNSLKAQLPASQDLTNLMESHNTHIDLDEPTGTAAPAGILSNFCPSGIQDEINLNAFNEFISTGIFDPENQALIDYLSSRSNTTTDPMTVIPGAYINTLELDVSAAWNS